MNKKLFSCFALFMLMMVSTSQQIFASSHPIPKISPQTDITVEDNEECSISDMIKRVSLKNKFQRSDETQINSFVKKYNRYSQQNNFKKLKELYSDSFINNDGFDKKTVFEMMEAVANVYKNTKYTTEIENITIDGNYAKVKIHETVTAEADNLFPKFNDMGYIVSSIDYIDYLVKESNKWKIQATEVLSEEVTMKYGEAKKMNVKITAPELIGSGIPYEVSVCANNPDGSFALGSIVNEQIIFPQKDSQDVFRALNNEKLSRILTSNKNNNNEYVTVSIALTRAEVEPSSININMTGMALAMKRVNVIPLAKKKETVNATK